MRVIKIDKETSGKRLAARLSPGDTTAAKNVLAALKAVNPHVDFNAIKPGMMLFVPELVDSRNSDAVPFEQAGFDALRAQVESSLEAVATRVRKGHQTLAARGKDMTAVFRSAAFKRALDATPDLKPLVDSATEGFKQDQANAKAADEVLKAIKQGALRDLDRLARMLD